MCDVLIVVIMLGNNFAHRFTMTGENVGRVLNFNVFIRNSTNGIWSRNKKGAHINNQFHFNCKFHLTLWVRCVCDVSFERGGANVWQWFGIEREFQRHPHENETGFHTAHSYCCITNLIFDNSISGESEKNKICLASCESIYPLCRWSIVVSHDGGDAFFLCLKLTFKLNEK